MGISEIIFVFFAFMGLMIIPQVFYLLTIQKTLTEISAENRKMQPNLVWLSLIPFFGIGWNFIIVSSLADSLKFEFKKRNIQKNEDKPGYSIGLTYCILFCCSIVPFFGAIAAVAGIVCWVIYWVKINNFKSELQSANLQ
jgi:hypothetical protein